MLFRRKWRLSHEINRRRRAIRYLVTRLLTVLAIAAGITGLIVADRAGVFGVRPEGDFQKYDGRTFRVVKVIDGDTLDVDVPDGQWDDTRVRLWGVDTPEIAHGETLDQHFGPQAADFTRRLTQGQNVRLELLKDRTRGVHGRLLAYVVLPDGRMLNRLLVEEGYGYADPRFEHPRRSEFRRLQTAARKAGKGLWKDLRPNDLPYYYRHELKLPASQPAP